MMRRLLAASIGLATLCLLAAFVPHGRQGWTLVIVLLGSLWLTTPLHGLRWASTLAWAFFVALAALGVLLGRPTLWLLCGVVAALLAWDLSYFSDYLDDVAKAHNGAHLERAELERAHLKRLGITAGLGWLLGALALGVRLRFDFTGALALALLLVLSLGLALRRMGQERKF
jgi:hypothetical protein